MSTKQTFRWTKAKGAILVGAIVAAIVAGTTTAVVMAAIPDSSGVIHGCYRSSGLFANGALRIIDSDTQNCNANETALNWNQAGAGNGGAIYGNRVTLPLGSSSGPELLAIPEVGEFMLQQCLEDNPDGRNGQVLYENTTTTTIEVSESGGIPTISVDVAPGETYLMNGESTNFVKGSGEESVIVRVALLGTIGETTPTCDTIIQAVVSSNNL